MNIYLNGKFIPLEQAQISILDRGFIFGDGVYEVIPVYSKHPFRLQQHLNRLQTSLAAVGINNPHTTAEWETICQTLIQTNSAADQSIYLHVTRGVASRDHAFPNPPVTPTILAMSSPLSGPNTTQIEQGIACITLEDNRWLNCHIKTTSALPNILLRQAALDAGCAEAILIRDNTFLTEGTASSIFVVKNGVLLTPPKDNFILPGVTYDVILEIAQTHHIPYEIRRIYKNEVLSADELMMSSSPKEILAITTLNEQAIGNGKPGPIFTKLHALYQAFKREVMRQHTHIKDGNND